MYLQDFKKRFQVLNDKTYIQNTFKKKPNILEVLLHRAPATGDPSLPSFRNISRCQSVDIEIPSSEHPPSPQIFKSNSSHCLDFFSLKPHGILLHAPRYPIWQLHESPASRRGMNITPKKKDEKKRDRIRKKKHNNHRIHGISGNWEVEMALRSRVCFQPGGFRSESWLRIQWGQLLNLKVLNI